MHSRPLTKEETLLRSLQRPSSDSDFVHVDTKYKDINSNVSSFGVIAYILSLGLGEKKKNKKQWWKEKNLTKAIYLSSVSSVVGLI